MKLQIVITAASYQGYLKVWLDCTAMRWDANSDLWVDGSAKHSYEIPREQFKDGFYRVGERALLLPRHGSMDAIRVDLEPVAITALEHVVYLKPKEQATK